MKERILTGWTFQRAIFLIMGTMVIIQSIMEKQWVGMVFGAYFASMGLFSFGCASGACFNPYQQKTEEPTNKNDLNLVEFEEIKQK